MSDSPRSPRTAESVRPPPATPLEGAALFLVPLALLSLSHAVPLLVFSACLAGAYLPEAALRPRPALATLVAIIGAVVVVRILRG